MKDLAGAPEVQTLARPTVQRMDNGAQLLGGDLRQVGALRQILPQEAVGVLVGSSLPGMVGMGEVDR